MSKMCMVLALDIVPVLIWPYADSYVNDWWIVVMLLHPVSIIAACLLTLYRQIYSYHKLATTMVDSVG